MVEIIAAIVGSTGAWQLLQYKLQTRDKKRTAVDEALLAVLHYILYLRLTQVLKRGCVGQTEYDTLSALYKPYQALGGNGSIRHRYEDMKKLPRVTDSEIEYFEQAK